MALSGVKAKLASLESGLYRSLSIPVPDAEDLLEAAAAAPAAVELARALSRLKQETRRLREEARRIGSVPLEYPRHLVIVMKLIAALLPWYTRPISTFGSRCADTMTEVTDVLDAVIRQQEAVSKQLASLNDSLGAPEEGGRQEP